MCVCVCVCVYVCVCVDVRVCVSHQADRCRDNLAFWLRSFKEYDGRPVWKHRKDCGLTVHRAHTRSVTTGAVGLGGPLTNTK